MLAARGRYSFMRHLLYSLLRGRTVVIYAHRRNEQHVRQLVDALSLFVPGASTQRVVPWQERPLLLHELASVKLVGLSKRVASIAKGVVQYSSILDYENETLQAPRYQHGDFVDVLLCPKKQWPSDETYVAYLHYQLFAFGIKACLYYRMCCVAITKSSVSSAAGARKATAATLQVLGNESILRDVGWQYSLTQSTRSRDEDTPVPLMGVPAELREQSKAVFSLAVKDMLPSDLAIIEYLADVVKEQQAVEMRAVDANAPLIRLSSAVLTNFTNASPSKR